MQTEKNISNKNRGHYNNYTTGSVTAARGKLFIGNVISHISYKAMVVDTRYQRTASSERRALKLARAKAVSRYFDCSDGHFQLSAAKMKISCGDFMSHVSYTTCNVCARLPCPPSVILGQGGYCTTDNLTFTLAGLLYYHKMVGGTLLTTRFRLLLFFYFSFQRIEYLFETFNYSYVRIC